MKNIVKNAETAKNTKKPVKNAVAFFTENAVKTARAGAGVGGRYSVKTRRLTLPVSFSGKTVLVSVVGKTLVVFPTGENTENARRVHPTQHFTTLPTGVVAVEKNTTLAVAKNPTLPVGVKLPADAVCYTLPA